MTLVAGDRPAEIPGTAGRMNQAKPYQIDVFLAYSKSTREFPNESAT